MRVVLTWTAARRSKALSCRKSRPSCFGGCRCVEVPLVDSGDYDVGQLASPNDGGAATDAANTSASAPDAVMGATDGGAG